MACTRATAAWTCLAFLSAPCEEEETTRWRGGREESTHPHPVPGYAYLDDPRRLVHFVFLLAGQVHCNEKHLPVCFRSPAEQECTGLVACHGAVMHGFTPSFPVTARLSAFTTLHFTVPSFYIIHALCLTLCLYIRLLFCGFRLPQLCEDSGQAVGM